MSGFAFKQTSGGFIFDNCQRNELLLSNGVLPGNVRKTGTTIAAIKYKDGVVIGADSRSTAGHIIHDENVLKIHRLSDNIYALGAGTAADCDFQARILESKLELLRLNQDRQVRVVTAVRMLQQHLYRYKGYIGAYLIIVGVDVTGSRIAAIEPYGTASYMPYIASGSGGHTSLSVIEDRFKQDMNENEAKQLVRDALYASITTDLYSGSKINMYVLTKEKLDKFLPYEIVAVRGDRQIDSILEKGVKVLSTSVKKIEFDIVNEKVKQKNNETDEAMELA
ncbi:unnamed protein product [Adineta steineri]|uniref:Proteasome subunit beta n=1 Tax=Adineta steineri TaxID=433720 RepID=A0A819QDV7_9BILA|nr:unnamed protein product [Adineta steineri]CAF4027920.1 unnamed protein product [Adineta steineri]CAF4056253.1 unnamed protein product [Adineta steineri]